MTTEPKILALCCNYCGYAAGDLAGSMRAQYPANVRVLRLPCTGKTDAGYLIKAFEAGVDGIMVFGCLEGGCHFQEGNLRAKRRVGLVKQLLEEAGFDSRRLEMFNLSSADGPLFANRVREMTERIKGLGLNPLRKMESLSIAAETVGEGHKLRQESEATK